MPVKKNQVLELEIESLSSDGSGVGRWDGQAIFVPMTAPGDRVRVRVVRPLKQYAFGIVEEILSPSPARIPVDCAVYRRCGGCQLRHIRYADELAAKQRRQLL